MASRSSQGPGQRSGLPGHAGCGNARRAKGLRQVSVPAFILAAEGAAAGIKDGHVSWQWLQNVCF